MFTFHEFTLPSFRTKQEVLVLTVILFPGIYALDCGSYSWSAPFEHCSMEVGYSSTLPAVSRWRYCPKYFRLLSTNLETARQRYLCHHSCWHDNQCPKHQWNYSSCLYLTGKLVPKPLVCGSCLQLHISGNVHKKNWSGLLFVMRLLDLGLSQFVSNFCFLLLDQEITASFFPKILEKNLVGHVTMEDFTLALKWSKIGHIRLYLIQVQWLHTKSSTLNSA